ncbi:OmpH family outer membrane protein [Flavobacteriaceae bacterium]|nr:OmpH family outer membrane protein [Flavobacteriaceae bacterium]
MKHLKSLLLAATLILSASLTLQAQSKVAHINTQELVESMPDMKSAKSELEKLAKTYETDIQAMATELQNKITQYDAESSTKTDEENGKRLQEVQSMEQSIRQYQAQAQQDLQKKELDLLRPITEKAKNAILKVGNAQGFDYVLDSSQGQGVIMANGKDLLTDVRTELGFY